MSTKPYLQISGMLFTLVSIAHLVRIVLALPVLIDSYALPMWVSWLGTIVPAFLAYSALRLLARASRENDSA